MEERQIEDISRGTIHCGGTDVAKILWIITLDGAFNIKVNMYKKIIKYFISFKSKFSKKNNLKY